MSRPTQPAADRREWARRASRPATQGSRSGIRYRASLAGFGAARLNRSKAMRFQIPLRRLIRCQGDPASTPRGGSRLDADRRSQRRRAHARPAPACAASAGAGTRGRDASRSRPSLPAVTTTVQSTLLTGTLPREHGIVGNGWYFRDLSEVWLWRQSNQLVGGEKVWDAARRRDPAFTCAKLFWWYNMYATVDFAVTPRPMYPADGRKLPDVYTEPAGLRDELQGALGRVPAVQLLGPGADIVSSRVDRRQRAARARAAPADAHARVPAAPRLRPAAPRAAASGHRRASRRTSMRLCGALIAKARSASERTWWCCPSTASPRCRGRFTSTARCAKPAG